MARRPQPLTCSLSAVYLQGEHDVIAYVPEIVGVHGQGATIEEARASLADALAMVLSANREFAQQSYRSGSVVHREPVRLALPKADH